MTVRSLQSRPRAGKCPLCVSGSEFTRETSVPHFTPYSSANNCPVMTAVCLLLLVQVVTLQHQYVRPSSDDLTELKLSDECKTLTGLTEDSVINAQPLDHVLDDVSISLCASQQ